jgi:RHS repeat-associated protein
MYYYLYRFYDPNLQRWINRDPISDLGFYPDAGGTALSDRVNLYRFDKNEPVDNIDAYGLSYSSRGGAIATHPTPGATRAREERHQRRIGPVAL